MNPSSSSDFDLFVFHYLDFVMLNKISSLSVLSQLTALIGVG